MGARSWLRGIFGKGPEIVGTSTGGSRLLRYGGREFARPQFGFTEEPVADLVAARESAYERLLGKCDFVYHEMLLLVPHIDVYRFPPAGRREFYTFVTSGMSDLPMNSPAELGAEWRRVELVFYASEDKQEYQGLLRRLAHFPHDNQTWLHWGHTMPNGTPPEPIFGSRCLDTFFFMPSILRPDSEFGQSMVWHGEPIQLVWCVPISSAECQLKLERGAQGLYDLFDERQHPFVFRGDRASRLLKNPLQR